MQYRVFSLILVIGIFSATANAFDRAAWRAGLQDHIRHTFTDERGEVSCVDRDYQPALWARGETAATPPKLDLPPIQLGPNEKLTGPFHECGRVDGDGNKMCCPNGTIVFRAGSGSHAPEKTEPQRGADCGGPSPSVGVWYYLCSDNDDGYCNYLFTQAVAAPFTAQIYKSDIVNNRGASAKLNVWAPYTKSETTLTMEEMEDDDDADSYCAKTDLSRSFISIENSDQTQGLQAGWMVSKAHYGDQKPHFVASDWGSIYCSHAGGGYYICASTGAQSVSWYSNEDASYGRLVIVDSAFEFGFPMSQSSKGGTQYVISVGWYQQDKTWRLLVNGKTVAYWETSVEIDGYGGTYYMTWDKSDTTDDLYNNGKVRIRFGGDVWVSDWETAYSATPTDMGSGAPPSSSYSTNVGNVAYQSEMYYWYSPDGKSTYAQTVDPRTWSKRVTNSSCYNLYPFEKQIYFGGVGYIASNGRCQ